MINKLFFACMLTISLSFLPFKAQSYTADAFTVVSDSKKDIQFIQFTGQCASLKEKLTKNPNKIASSVGCTSNPGIRIEGGTQGTFKVAPGKWVVGIKRGLLHPENYVPAVCFANPDKPGRILRFYTPKSETARSLFGKSMGFGLDCEQIEKMPE